MNNSVDEYFKGFLRLHGGEMKQLANMYMRSKNNFVLREFVIDYLDRINSNLAIALLTIDPVLIDKLESYLLR